MDAAGVDVQALSLTSPGVEQLDVEEARRVAHESNEALAEGLRTETRSGCLDCRTPADPRSRGL